MRKIHPSDRNEEWTRNNPENHRDPRPKTGLNRPSFTRTRRCFLSLPLYRPGSTYERTRHRPLRTPTLPSEGSRPSLVVPGPLVLEVSLTLRLPLTPLTHSPSLTPPESRREDKGGPLPPPTWSVPDGFSDTTFPALLRSVSSHHDFMYARSRFGVTGSGPRCEPVEWSGETRSRNGRHNTPRLYTPTLTWRKWVGGWVGGTRQNPHHTPSQDTPQCTT